MIQSRPIGSLTEIYTEGGGEFITQSSPTYFHTFFTRKVLGKNEQVQDFMEVTSLQKEKIEANDVTFVEPPKSFVDQWNSACGTYGKYNEATGYFELNGLIDITYKQAVKIYELYSEPITRLDEPHHSFQNTNNIRTLIPYSNMGNPSYLTSNYFDISEFEVIRISKKQPLLLMAPVSNFFGRNGKIRAWLDVVIWFGNTAYNNNKATFSFNVYDRYTNHPFEYFRFGNVNFNVACQYYPNIGIDSFQYLVANRFPLTTTGANPFTVTVHPDIYVKLIDPKNVEWNTLLNDALAKDIQFVTTEPVYIKSGIGVMYSDGSIVDYNNPNFENIDTDDVIGITLETTLADYDNQEVNLILSTTPTKCYFSNGQRPVDESLYKYDGLLNKSLWDFDGESNTALLTTTLKETAWAVNVCDRTTINGQKCYLPAMGECNAIMRNITTINEILTKLGKTVTVPNVCMWSSCVGTVTEETGFLNYVFGYNSEGYADGLNVQGYYMAWPVTKLQKAT